MTTTDRPWLRFYGSVPASIDYPRVTLFDTLAATAERVPEAIATDFFGARSTYRELLAAIDRAAAALASLGLRSGDRLLIAMPTAPAGVIAFYAANKLGVLPALIHPLSAPPEIEHYLDISGARVLAVLLRCPAPALRRARAGRLLVPVGAPVAAFPGFTLRTRGPPELSSA